MKPLLAFRCVGTLTKVGALALLASRLGAQSLPVPEGLSSRPTLLLAELSLHDPDAKTEPPAPGAVKRPGLDLEPFGTWKGSDILPFRRRAAGPCHP
jgi:hypothetical protein